jgi:hypothetical protein
MKGESGCIYNGISVLFLLLTVGMIVFVVIQMMRPLSDRSDLAAAIPTPLDLPTLTPSNTPTETFTPTITPIPTDTPTPTVTPSETPTIPPSPTLTDTPGPTATPSDTPTPVDTPTPTATATPIGPTATFTPTDSPFFFELRGEIFLGPNTVNTAGCAWQGIGGNVLGMDGQETTRQYQVRVFGGGLERTVVTGSNSLYGQFSGWEVPVGNTASSSSYFVRLESAAGVQLSPDVPVSFPGDCNANSAIVRFIQIRPIGTQPEEGTG